MRIHRLLVLPTVMLLAGADDILRVKVVAGTMTTVFQRAGSATNRPGAWVGGSADLSALAGQTIRILIEVADAGTGSLIEAGIDGDRPHDDEIGESRRGPCPATRSTLTATTCCRRL